MQLIKSEFSCRGQDGDFSWMIDRPEYARSLFIFNDNAAQFLAFHAGHHGGYQQLDKNVRALVDDAIAHIRGLLATGNYDQVIFSYDSRQKTIGTGIFKVADEVKTYIYESICSLGDPQ